VGGYNVRRGAVLQLGLSVPGAVFTISSGRRHRAIWVRPWVPYLPRTERTCPTVVPQLHVLAGGRASAYLLVSRCLEDYLGRLRVSACSRQLYAWLEVLQRQHAGWLCWVVLSLGQKEACNSDPSGCWLGGCSSRIPYMGTRVHGLSSMEDRARGGKKR